MKFKYSSTTPLNGIIHYLYTEHNGEYGSDLKYYATSSTIYNGRVLTANHAFDYGPNNYSLYWLGDESQEGPINLTFCFPNHFLKITGLELATSSISKRKPKIFRFSSSLDNITYKKSIDYTGNFTSALVNHFSFNSPLSKCFCLTCINDTLNNRAFDLDHIELYGEIHSSLDLFFNTCRSVTLFLTHNIFLLFPLFCK